MGLDFDIEEVRKKNRGRNVYYDTDLRTVDLFSDEAINVGEVVEYLAFLGFTVRSKVLISQSDINQSKRDFIIGGGRQWFDYVFSLLKEPISMEKLERYASVENPELIEKFRSGMDLREILYTEFIDICNQDGNLPHKAFEELIKGSQSRDSHSVTIFSRNNLVQPIPLSETEFGNGHFGLSYHAAGRKGKAYGTNFPTWFLEQGNNHRAQSSSVVVNATPLRDYSDFQQINFIIEMLNHEILGHQIMGLNDHFDLASGSCMMATKNGDREYLDITQKRKGVYLCDTCLERL